MDPILWEYCISVSRFFLLLLLVISFFVIIICILISNRKAKYFQLDFNAGEIVESEIVKERTEETPKTKPPNGNITVMQMNRCSLLLDYFIIISIKRKNKNTIIRIMVRISELENHINKSSIFENKI